MAAPMAAGWRRTTLQGLGALAGAHVLVIVITAGIADWGMMTVPEELMGQFILRAVKSSAPLPENPSGLAQLRDHASAFGNRP